MRTFRATIIVGPQEDTTPISELSDAIITSMAGETLYSNTGRNLGIIDDVMNVEYTGEVDA